MPESSIKSRSRRYLLTLSALTLFVLAFPMAVWQLGFLPDEVRNGVRRIFSVGLENNLGAWWSGGLLFLAAVHGFDGFRRYRDRGEAKLAFAWLVMACVIVALSLDEIGSLHERVGQHAGWWGLLPFGIVIVASVTWASWQMWTDPAERRSIVMIAVAFGLFAATALNEYIEHAFEWPAWLRPWRTGFEEGLELVGMLILVSVALRNSGGAFQPAAVPEEGRPCLWITHAMPAWILIAVAAVSPFLAVLTTGLHDTYRGRPADWLASMMFLLAALAAWRPALCSTSPDRYPSRVVFGLLLLAASAACVAIYPQWHAELGPVQVNARLCVIAFLLLGAAGFTGMRERTTGGLRLTYLWLIVACLAGVLAVVAQALPLQQLACEAIAILAYATAAPAVIGSISGTSRLLKKGDIARG